VSPDRLIRSPARTGATAGMQRDRGVRIDLCVPADMGAPATARRGVSALCPYAEDPLMGDVLLLVSELVTNCVRHARLKPEDWIRVRVDLAPGAVRLDVCDAGVGFTPSRPRPRAPEELGGRGLLLVDRIADRCGVDSGGRTRVWAEIDRI
jgi:anti-sigma regulatory factor (Ser/Thr protein kinase)